MATILKVECEGDLRRALLPGAPSFADVNRAIQEIWPGRSADGGKYMDEEGDACTLKELTFPDFLATARDAASGTVLRLQLAAGPAPGAIYEGDGAPEAARGLSGPWQHVEQGSEAGDRSFHTVADLTDMQEEEEEAEKEAPQSDSLAHLAVPCDAAASPEAEAEAPVQCQPGVADAAPEAVECAAAALAEQELGRPSHGTAAAAGPAEPEHLCRGTVEKPLAERVEPAHGSANTAGAAPEYFIIDHEVGEKIDIVIAAFDEDGDSFLSFAEMRTLHGAAWNGELSPEVFQQMCVDEGEDPDVGLGKEALMCIYSRCTALDRDFEVARLKLEGGEWEPRSGQPDAKGPIDLVWEHPRLAVPVALDTAERLCQKVGQRIATKLFSRR